MNNKTTLVIKAKTPLKVLILTYDMLTCFPSIIYKYLLLFVSKMMVQWPNNGTQCHAIILLHVLQLLSFLFLFYSVCSISKVLTLSIYTCICMQVMECLEMKLFNKLSL